MVVSNERHNMGVPGGQFERRRHRRQSTDAAVELIWKDDGHRRFECGSLVDISVTGACVVCPQPINVSSYIVLRAPGPGIVALSQVRNCVWGRTQYQLGVEFLEKAATQPPENVIEPDYHALLRAGVAGDAESVDRLYRALAFRYHPDHRDNGDAEVFLRIREIYRILAPSQRYQEELEVTKPLKTTGLKSELRGLKDKRLEVLSLLCQRRVSDYRNAYVSSSDLESLTGMSTQEAGFVLWYLREKGAVTLSDNTPGYTITAVGVDVLENTHRSDGDD